MLGFENSQMSQISLYQVQTSDTNQSKKGEVELDVFSDLRRQSLSHTGSRSFLGRKLWN